MTKERDQYSPEKSPKNVPEINQGAVVEALGHAYKVYTASGQVPVARFCAETWEADKVPVLYGVQGIGKTGVIEPYLRALPNGSTSQFEIGSEKQHSPDFARPVLFVTIRNPGQSTQHEIDHDIRDLKNLYPELENRTFSPNELSFYPNGQQVVHIIQETIGREIPILGTPWYQKKIDDILNQGTTHRPLSQLLQKISDLIRETRQCEPSIYRDRIYPFWHKIRTRLSTDY